MQKSVEAHRSEYQTYQDWIAHTDSSGSPVNQPVITAVQAGDITTLKRLVTEGVDINKVKGDNPTLLFNVGSAEVAEFLIQHGADVNAANASGDTALDSVVNDSSSKAAAIAAVLLDHGADPNHVSGDSRTTPALRAYRGDTLDVLAAHGANLKTIDADGYGAMFMAGRSDATYIEALIRHGITFDPKKDGPTVMVQASWINNQPVMKCRKGG
jgi:ankyrin repeat protein